MVSSVQRETVCTWSWPGPGAPCLGLATLVGADTAMALDIARPSTKASHEAAAYLKYDAGQVANPPPLG